MTATQRAARTIEPLPSHPPVRRLRLGRAWLWLPLLVYTLARLPAFVEPRWYTDEAGYATTGRDLLHGARLYSEIWTNKPPLAPLSVGVPTVLGLGEWGLHLLTFVAGLLTLLAVAWGGRRLLGPRRAALAVLATSLLLGSPVFDAELAVPESVLIAPATWAGVLLLVALDRASLEGTVMAARSVVAIAGLAAAALAYQQTELADVCAFGLILLLASAGGRRPLLLYAAVVGGITVAWLGASLALAGPGTVGFALAGFYIPYSQASLPQSGGGLVRHGILLGICVFAAVAGSTLLRRSASLRWGIWLWAAAALLVPAAAQQPFAHFVIPAVAPTALALAALPVPRRRPTRREGAGALALVSGLALAGVLARAAGVDWIPQGASNGASDTRTLATYYVGALGAATGRQPLSAWQQSFDDRVASDDATAAFIRDRGLRSRTTVVWSSDAWLYLEADLPLLLRTAPIYNNEVLLGIGGPVADRVSALAPQTIITSNDALTNFDEINPLLARRYRQVAAFGFNTVWVRSDLPTVGTG